MRLKYFAIVILFSGCHQPFQTPMSASVPVETAASVSSTPAPAVVVPPVVVGPPVAADPPILTPKPEAPSCQPLNPANIAWGGPFRVDIPGSCFGDAWRAERVDIESGALNGFGTAPAIPSAGRGTITLSGSMSCGRSYQVDLFRSGSTQMFAAAGVVYRGPDCPEPPVVVPTPVVPVPVVPPVVPPGVAPCRVVPATNKPTPPKGCK